MKSVYDYLTESPMAVIDDWEGEKIKLGAMRYKAFAKYWKRLETLSPTDPLEAYIIKDGLSGRVVYGKHIGDDLGIYVEMTIIFRSDTKFIKPNTIIISGVKTDIKMRYSGYASELYKILLKNGYSIMSDQTQYNGARKIYQKLHDSEDYTVSLWDDENKKFIHDETLVLLHGEDDWDIDADVWSWDNSKSQYKIVISNKV